MWPYLMIALGGALGSVCRYVSSEWLYQVYGRSFPIGILSVNVLGCFIMGFLALCFVDKAIHTQLLRPLLLTGFLGGFTTFSSFSLDAIQLLLTGAYLRAFLYVAASLLLSLLAAFAGVWLARGILCV